MTYSQCSHDAYLIYSVSLGYEKNKSCVLDRKCGTKQKPFYSNKALSSLLLSPRINLGQLMFPPIKTWMIIIIFMFYLIIVIATRDGHEMCHGLQRL